MAHQCPEPLREWSWKAQRQVSLRQALRRRLVTACGIHVRYRPLQATTQGACDMHELIARDLVRQR